MAKFNPDKLWDHQRQTLNLLRTHERTLDFSDPGTGKTLVALAAFAERRSKAGSGCALVIAPKSLLVPAWGNEIQEYFPDLKYSIAYAHNRKEAFAEHADVYITNTDAVKWLADQPMSMLAKFDTVIIDEVHYFKHRTSARSKAAKKIMRRFKYRHGMTGTPNSNSVTDLWHIALLIDGGERLGTSFFHFRNAVCEAKQVGPRPNMVKWVDKDGALETVASLLGDISVRHKFADCMDIPPNHTYTLKYKLSPSNLSQYRALQKDAVLRLQNDTISAVNEAALRTKLLQVAAGVVYADTKTQVLDTGRCEFVIDLVEKRQHSVVFFNWSHQKEQLIKEAQKRGVTYEVIDGSVSIRRREEIVAAYQAGFFQTLFLHPKTGAHGLTLTKGTTTIWASPIYEPDALKQGLHRIYRGGQTEKTETILIEAEDTVEKHVYDILRTKNSKMVKLLDLLEK